MLIDGISLVDSSVIANTHVESGPAFPAGASTGRMFYLNAAYSGNAPGLYVYNGSSWVTGDITKITVGSGLTGGGDSGDVSIGVDTDVVATKAYVDGKATVQSVAGRTGAVTLTTNDVAENSNLYFTQARARAALSATGSINYNSSTGVFSFTMPTTDGVAEGVTNKYFSNTLARGAISVSGDMTYNSATGVLGYVLPKASTGTLGGVRQGKDLAIDSSGIISLALTTSNTYATLDPTFQAAATYTEGNLRVSGQGNYKTVRSTLPLTSKSYFEVTYNAVNGSSVGLVKSSVVDECYMGYESMGELGTDSIAYQANSSCVVYNGIQIQSSVISMSTGDKIGIAFDASTNTVSFFKNGTKFYETVISAGTWFAGASNNGSAGNLTFNFGQNAFTYAAPAGYNSGVYLAPTAVTSINGRSGNVTVTSADVTTALGFTPVSNAVAIDGGTY